MKYIYILLISLLLSISLSANATTTLIVPAGAGGLLHRYAIEIQPLLSEILEDTVVIQVKPGADGLIGAKYLVESFDTGTKLYIGPKHRWENKNQYDYMTELQYMGTVPSIFFSAKHSSLKTVLNIPEFSFGVPGSSAALGVLNPFKPIEIKYGGGTEILTDVYNKSLDIGLTVANILKPAESMITPLAVLGPKRSNILPNVPTARELGIVIPNEDVYCHNIFMWVGKNTDPKLQQALKVKINTLLKDPRFNQVRNKLDIVNN